jgi:hypothetical protein
MTEQPDKTSPNPAIKSWENDDTFEKKDLKMRTAFHDIGGDLKELTAKVEEKVRPLFKAFLQANKTADDGRTFDEILATDPDALKSFEELMKSEASNQVLKRQLATVTDMVLSMTMDPDMTRDAVDSYDFPHERVKPVVLRRAGNSIPARLIKTYRFHQFAEFGKASDGKNAGFKLAFMDADYKPKSAELKKIAEFEKIFAKQFFFIPNETKPNLPKWLNYAYNDFFDMDKIAIEVVRTQASTASKFNYRGEPLGLQLVDAGTVYHILPKQRGQHVDLWRWDRPQYESALREAKVAFEYADEYRYIQVDSTNTRQAAYTEDKMILSHAFGSTDVKEQFQGFSIIEQSLQIIRYIIDSIIYNYTRRSAGTMPKGIIQVEGATEDGFSREEMELFRKIIWGIASGSKDKWKYPVFGTPKGVKTNFVRFHESSKEMEDFLWMSTLFSMMCSFAGMDPENIALASQKSTLGKQNMFSREAEEGANYRSRDEGLRFFLSYVGQIINNSQIIEEMTGIPDLEWRWVGLDIEDESKKRELDLKALQADCSINDIRVAADKKPFELEFMGHNIYDLPAVGNPQFLQLVLQSIQAEQAEKQQNDQFMSGGDGMGWGDDEEGNIDYIGGQDFGEDGNPSPDNNKEPDKSKPQKPAAPPKQPAIEKSLKPIQRVEVRFIH